MTTRFYWLLLVSASLNMPVLVSSGYILFKVVSASSSWSLLATGPSRVLVPAGSSYSSVQLVPRVTGPTRVCTGPNCLQNMPAVSVWFKAVLVPTSSDSNQV